LLEALAKNYKKIIPKKYIDENNILEFESRNFLGEEYHLNGYFESKNSYISFGCWSYPGKEEMDTLFIIVMDKEDEESKLVKKPGPLKKIACTYDKFIDESVFLRTYDGPKYRNLDSYRIYGIDDYNGQLFQYYASINNDKSKAGLIELLFDTVDISNTRIRVESSTKVKKENQKLRELIYEEIRINRLSGKVGLREWRYYPDLSNLIAGGVAKYYITGSCSKMDKQTKAKF